MVKWTTKTFWTIRYGNIIQTAEFLCLTLRELKIWINHSRNAFQILFKIFQVTDLLEQ